MQCNGIEHAFAHICINKPIWNKPEERERLRKTRRNADSIASCIHFRYIWLWLHYTDIYIYIVVSCARVFARSKKSGGAGRSVNERKSVWVSSILIFYKIYWIFFAVSSGVCFVSFDAPNARAHSLCAWTECPNIVYIYIELMSADNAHRSYSYVAAPVLVRQLNTFSYVYVLFRFLSCCSLPRVWVFSLLIHITYLFGHFLLPLSHCIHLSLSYCPSHIFMCISREFLLFLSI